MHSDHDLLITLIATTKEGFRSIHESVGEIKTNLDKKANSEYVATLEKRLENTEKEVKSANKKLYLISGGAAVVQFAVVTLLAFFEKAH